MERSSCFMWIFKKIPYGITEVDRQLEKKIEECIVRKEQIKSLKVVTKL